MVRFSEDPGRFRIPLKPVLYEGVEIDLDPETGGVWLDDGELQKIIKLREKVFTPQELQEMAERPRIYGVPQAELDREARLSPVTGEPMTPVNYGGDSGIIIDRDPDSGGVWLDPGELEKIQQLIEAWEDLQPEKRAEIEALLRRTEAEWDAEDDVNVQFLSMLPPRVHRIFPGIRRFLNATLNNVLDLTGH